MQILERHTTPPMPQTDQVQRFCDLLRNIPEKDLSNLLISLEALIGMTVNQSASSAPREQLLTDRISAREKEILVLIASGYTRRDISNTLGITIHTAASHIHHIYQKIGISSVAEATQIAISEGLLQCAISDC